MLNMLNLFFNKESSPEDRSDSNFETCTIPQGDDSFFLEFSIKSYAGNEVIFWVLVELWMSLFCSLLPSLPVNVRRSVSNQSSHQCLPKRTEFNQSAKNFHASYGSCFTSDHKQSKQFTMLGLCLNSPFALQFQKELKK